MARITKIGLENFKGIGEYTEFDLKPITLLFGANSAGKSTILHALHYARDLFKHNNLNPYKTLSGGEFVDLGGFNHCVHQHDIKNEIVFTFEFEFEKGEIQLFTSPDKKFLGSDFNDDDLINQAIDEIDKAAVSIAICQDRNMDDGSHIIHFFEVKINGQSIGKIWCYNTGDEWPVDNEHELEDFFEGCFITVNSLHPLFNLTNNEEKNSTTNASWLTSMLQHLTCSTHGGSYTLLLDEQKIYLGDTNEKMSIINLYDLDEKPLIERYLAEKNMINKSSTFTKDEIAKIKNYFLSLSMRLQFELVFSRLFFGTERLLREALSEFTYLGPIRIIPDRNQKLLYEKDPSGMANGLSAWHALTQYDPSSILFGGETCLVDNVNRWLCSRDHLNAGYYLKHKVYKEFDKTALEALKCLLDENQSSEEDFDTHVLLHDEFLPNLQDKTRLILVPVDSSGVEFVTGKYGLGEKMVIKGIESSQELQPQDVGIGISQVIPVLVVALNASRGVVGIEQPELHLHPQMQSELGDLFIRCAHEHKQFLIETHSEHLLLRILRRIREQHEGTADEDAPKITPEDVSVLYFEKTGEGNRIHNLRIDDTGEFIDQWPEGFFDERDKELF